MSLGQIFAQFGNLYHKIFTAGNSQNLSLLITCFLDVLASIVSCTALGWTTLIIVSPFISLVAVQPNI